MIAINFNAEEVVTATSEDIMEWNELKSQIKTLQAKEMALRLKIAKTFFNDPSEGTNTTELGNGWKLKMQYKLDRKVDIAMLTNLAPQLRKHVNLDELVEAKPVLKISAYRKLEGEGKKLFEQCLETKPASPSLELVEPKVK